MLRLTLLATITAIVLPAAALAASSSSVSPAKVGTSPVADFDAFHCRLPKTATVDRTIAQIGKVRPAAAEAVMTLPTSVIRGQAQHARAILREATVSYARCTQNPG